MAEDNPKNKEKQKSEKDKSTKGSGSFTLVTILIIAGSIVLSSAVGVVMSLILVKNFPREASAGTEVELNAEETLVNDAIDKTIDDKEPTWYFDLPAIVANLDVPGATRYVRTVLTLELTFNPESPEEGTEFKEKIPVLTNWLILYLSSLGVDDTRGGRNQKHMQSQILDNFNNELYPDARPRIKSILFKEFAIQ